MSERRKTIDWNFWEKKYGRSLSDAEKSEIFYNLTGLIDLLHEEYSKNPDLYKKKEEEHELTPKDRINALEQRLKKSLE